ncbi:MAG: hypothetical protein ACXWNU_00835 [Candidatus Binataceae bacterium]
MASAETVCPRESTEPLISSLAISRNRPIVNEVDRDAATLLGAHVEYWGNPHIFDVIARHIL